MEIELRNNVLHNSWERTYISRGAVVSKKWKSGDKTSKNIRIFFMVWVPERSLIVIRTFLLKWFSF